MGRNFEEGEEATNSQNHQNRLACFTHFATFVLFSLKEKSEGRGDGTTPSPKLQLVAGSKPKKRK